MKPNRSNRPRLRAQRRGFALVISLSLMVLLTVLAVGLLTLSAVSLRASGSGEARAEAEANARMALMLAIGELQTSMGPDQRVSARASSLSEGASEPNMLGAWESWHWTPGSSGPNYGDKEGKFRRWLVSSRDQNQVESVGAAQSALEDPVSLIDPKTVGTPGGNGNPGAALRATRVPLQLSETRKGAFAWAVLDESLKAPIQLRDKLLDDNGEEKQPTNGEKIAMRQAPLRAHPEEILGSLDPEKLGDPAKLVSLQSAVIAAELNGSKGAGKDILKYQADVTPYSVGLLTDTANGGLKTDLTTLFESTSVSPNVNDKQTVYYSAADGAPRWDYIRSHYQLNRRIQGTAAGAPQLTLSATDLRPAKTGIIPSPATERLMPVIAKLQVMFSMVSHNCHISDRVDFFNTKATNPSGNGQYGAPHLVYDPVITLYNPYDVTLSLTKLRVRIWDPPVVFGFKKNQHWLRNEFSSPQGFQGLARFQIKYEGDPNARRYFTLYLRDATKTANPQPGAPILLAPGEVKLFSPWVERDWTWAKETETGGGYAPRAFFDWNADLDFGNRDGRTGQAMGVESVSGWDPRAGFQADHLSYANRPQATRYDFEIANNWNGGWLGIKLSDTFTAEARAARTIPTSGASANLPDFRVDVLAGSVQDYNSDILRTYQFKMGNPAAEMRTAGSAPIISRTFRVGDILQARDDKTTGGKTPFAILSMAAKTTADPNDYAMPWLHNHPVVEGVDQNSTKVGNALDTYDLSFAELRDFSSAPNGIEFDKDSKRGYFGASSFSNRGVSNVPMFRVPLIPATSLGDLVPANLTASSNLPRVTHALGNSRAHPLLPSGAVAAAALTGTGQMLDHSYLLNDVLWDSTYFSTIASYSNALVANEGRSSLLKSFLEGRKRLLNPRFIPMVSGEGSAADQASELDGTGELELSRKMASVQAIEGPFNVNSDSVEAWKAMLTSLRDSPLLGWSNTDMAPGEKTGFPRASLPIAGDPESNNSQDVLGVAGQARWAGFRALDDDQIQTLATNIVKQIRLRAAQDSAPSLTLGEFINRRLGSADGLQVNEGIIQKAILDSKVNDSMHADDSKDLATAAAPLNPAVLKGLANATARKGFSAEGAPAILTQGDIMMALAPVITVRGDTFRVRAYGESRDPDDKVVAKAWCEAIVQRTPEYLDGADAVEVKPAALQSEANKRFGRRFTITSFRWLSPEEV